MDEFLQQRRDQENQKQKNEEQIQNASPRLFQSVSQQVEADVNAYNQHNPDSPITYYSRGPLGFGVQRSVTPFFTLFVDGAMPGKIAYSGVKRTSDAANEEAFSGEFQMVTRDGNEPCYKLPESECADPDAVAHELFKPLLPLL